MLKRVLFIFSSVLLFSVVQYGQQTTSSPSSNQQIDEKKADVAITAIVRARELKFEIVGDPRVEFPGTPERKTEWSAERENLPATVQPGVTYRDIGIRLKIASVFADIDRIVAEALGELPATAEPKPDEKKSSVTNPNTPSKTPRR